MDCQHSTSAHALSYSGYHFRYVSILKSSLCPPALFIYKHMHSLHSPCPAPLSYFPESCITCKHGGVTSSCFKISWHFTLPAAWVKSAEVTVSLNSKDFFQCNVWIYAMFLFKIGYFSMSWNVKTCFVSYKPCQLSSEVTFCRLVCRGLFPCTAIIFAPVVEADNQGLSLFR
jgi:hypothetical protein